MCCLSFFVAVHEKPSGFPRIDRDPQTETVERTKSVSLICQATGTPQPIIKWYKDYLPLNATGSQATVSPTGKHSV